MSDSILADIKLYTGLIKSEDKSIDEHLYYLASLYKSRDTFVDERSVERRSLESQIKLHEDEIKKAQENKQFCEKEITYYISKL